MLAEPTHRLHHIGFLTGDLGGAAAHFSANLGYRIESDVIDDVGQTAQVQFLRQPGARHWLELVAPLGPESKLTAALKLGTSLHHQCYETPDLNASLARMRNGGCMPVLRPMPGTAFDGRLIAWMMDPFRGLIELVQAGPGARSLAVLDMEIENA